VKLDEENIYGLSGSYPVLGKLAFCWKKNEGPEISVERFRERELDAGATE